MRWGLATFSLAVVCALIGFVGPALADAGEPYGHDSAPEWARAQLLAGKPADFNVKCPAVAKAVPPDPCRTITASFLENLIMQTDLTGQRRIDLSHAIVVGDLDLRDASIAREVSVEDSFVDGDVDLARAQFGSQLSFNGSTIRGNLTGSGVHVVRDLKLRGTTLRGVDFAEAVIDGDLRLDEAEATRAVALLNAQIGADLHLEAGVFRTVSGQGLRVGERIYANAEKAPVNLDFADSATRGDVWLGGKLGSVMLDSIHIGGTLHMDDSDTSYRGNVILDGAAIDHYWQLRDAHFASRLSGESLHVGQQTRFENVTAGMHLNLKNARFDGDLVFTGGSTFDGEFDLSGAHVSGAMTVRDTNWQRLVNMRLLHVDQDLDMAGATLPALRLTGAVIQGALRLGNVPEQPDLRACWSKRTVDSGAPASSCTPDRDAALDLQNARVGTVEGNFAAWPPDLQLSGFTYTRINARTGEVNPDKDAWDGWLRRDGTYSAQHYQQLAAALAADGDREGASDMQFKAREREREAACGSGRYLTCGFLSLLSWVAGYGIGDYTWRAVYWVLGLTFIGGLCVWQARKAESRNIFWPFGASLERLLPYVQLDRTFTEFFEQQRNFRLWHKLVFGVLALMGSILGLFLAAAASGLTQKG